SFLFLRSSDAAKSCRSFFESAFQVNAFPAAAGTITSTTKNTTTTVVRRLAGWRAWGPVMTGQTPGGYAGDVSARFAFEDLSRTADATLVDVRTAAEWIYVGVPLLSGIGKETILIEWEAFPT